MKTFKDYLKIVTEAEMDLKPNHALYAKALKKAEEKAKYGNDYLLTILKGMNPKKLSVADIESLKDIVDGHV